MKISVITPSVRPEMLEIVEKCLSRQTLQNYEWLVGSPKDYGFGIWVQDPPKRKGDYYSLNKSWNAMFKKAKGELIVSIVDGLWFPPNVLEKLWVHYRTNPLFCIGGVGGQYDELIDGKPEHLVWQDPRITGKGFYEISPMDMEWCIASVPAIGLKEIGGMDENFDRYAALSEKEANIRMSKLGYKFYLDESIEYRAIKHDRISPEWDTKYQEGIGYFQILSEKY